MRDASHRELLPTTWKFSSCIMVPNSCGNERETLQGCRAVLQEICHKTIKNLKNGTNRSFDKQWKCIPPGDLC